MWVSFLLVRFLWTSKENEQLNLISYNDLIRRSLLAVKKNNHQSFTIDLWQKNSAMYVPNVLDYSLNGWASVPSAVHGIL